MTNDEDIRGALVEKLPLRALGLRTGMALQTRRLVEGASKKEAQYFGAIAGKGVMVGPMGSDGVKTELEEGEVCVVRGFTGQYEFSFLSKVLQTFEKPFAYALLAYPAHVDARMVRQSMRTKVSWPTTVEIPDKDNPSNPKTVEATLVDVSMQGAMIKADSPLAAVGESVKLFMTVTIDGTQENLSVVGTICHNNKAANEDFYFIGMAFKNTTQHDKLVLHYVTQTPLNRQPNATE